MLLSASCSSHIYFEKCPPSMSAVGTRAMQEFDLGRWKLIDEEIKEQYKMCVKVKVKQSCYRPGVTQRVAGSYGFHISWQWHRMVVRSALRISRLHPQEMLLALIFVRGWVDPRAVVQSEGFYVNEKFQWHQLGQTSNLPICSTAHKMSVQEWETWMILWTCLGKYDKEYWNLNQRESNVCHPKVFNTYMDI